jgi:hypothetical protein
MPSIIGWIKNGRKGKNLAYMPASYPSERVAYGDGSVKDALDEVNADIVEHEKHVISTRTEVDLSSYTSNPFIVPADGYVCATCATTGTTGYVRINDIAIIAVPVNQSTDCKNAFVRKGSSIKVSGSFYIVKYYPLQ